MTDLKDKTSWIDTVIRDVAELSDRDSPEDWPEAMLVTAKELRNLIQTNALVGFDELARRLEEAQQKILTLEIHGTLSPCRCVVDGDDGTLAHLCVWHARWLMSRDAKLT